MTTRLLPRSASLLTAALASGALLVGLPASSGAAARTAADRPATSHSIVTLRADRVARSAPRSSAGRITTVAGRRPLTDVRTVLPVLASKVDAAGATWLRVRLPGRPNGRKGWISAARTTRSSTPWALAVDLASRTVVVNFRGHTIRRFRSVIGASRTPTPRGHYFVEEAVALDPGTEGGPYALAISARSNVLQEFNGGPGQIALHGTDGLSADFGSAASHGCVRLSTAAITWLAGRIDAGTPVSVR